MNQMFQMFGTGQYDDMVVVLSDHNAIFLQKRSQ